MALQTSARQGLAVASSELGPSIAVAVLAARTIRPSSAPTTPTPSFLRDAALRSPSSTLSRLNGHIGLSARCYSTVAARPLQPQPRAFVPTAMRLHPAFQSRTPVHVYNVFPKRFFSSSISRSLLANREEVANRNPGSPTAQNAFYQVLLKANMPAIVVERFQSGRFASNDATLESYHRALGMISSAAANNGAMPVAAPGTVSIAGAAGQSTPQIQAIGQAVAAHARGAGGSTATQAPGGPIHVVVNESFFGNVFRWVKFAAWFGLIAYVCMVVLSIAFEMVTTVKKTGNKVNSEVKAEKQTTKFGDVHGCDEAKEELLELVEFLKNPALFSTLGGKPPKGVLLVGPPGTGKTLLARAVAGEAGVPFHYMSGSEFDEVFVGVGARRVRDLFAAAKTHAPSIIFIDELDAIGAKRNARDAAYVKQTLNQLLTELDGFNQDSGVIIIGATNFPELLDPALTRPGRFDRHVRVDLPDVRGRIAILKHHARKIKASPAVNLEAIALVTSGLSGAELENIVNQAAIHASKAKKAAVDTVDFDWAKDKVIMGAEKRSMVIDPTEKEMTAYHEAGHALIRYYSKTSTMSLYKVTILPRGQTLGHTAYLPPLDRYSKTAKDYFSDIEAALGGLIAERLQYGPDGQTSGVSQDLVVATSLAYAMVARFGMSEKLGPMEFHSRFEYLSPATRELVESEVQRTLKDAQDRGIKLLTEKRKELDLLAKALVEYETLDVKEVEKVIRGEELVGRTKMPKGAVIMRPAGPSPLEGMTPFPGPGETETGGPPPPPVAPPPVGKTC
ncbi:hypothetical protein RB601_003817 [Gaeumannomyces tritici]